MPVPVPADNLSESNPVSAMGAGDLVGVEMEPMGIHGDEDLKETLDFDGGTSSIPFASFNFINSIVGAGIIGLPFAVKEAGIGLGIILLLLCGILTDFSVRMLVDTARNSGCKDYEEVCEKAFGRLGYYSVSAMMFIFAFGAMIAYFVIIGDTFSSVFGMWGFHVERKVIILVCAFLIILPLSSLRDMSSLSYTSAVSVGCDVVIVIVVLFKSLFGADVDPADYVNHTKSAAQHPKGMHVDPWDFAHSAFMQAFGAMCFAYVCQHSCLLVFQSLSNPSTQRWNIVTHISVGTAIIMSMLLSISAYSKFEMETQANVLNNFPQNDGWIAMCRLLLAMTMFFTYPMEFFVCRHSWISTVHEGWEDTNFLHYSVTVCIFGASLLLALLTDDLGFILELTGGFAATFLGFILPAACWLKLEAGGLEGVCNCGALSEGKKMGAVFLLIFGIFSMVVCTGLTLYNEFK